MASGVIQRPFDLNKVNPKFAYSLTDGNTDKFYVSSSARIVLFTIDSNANKCGGWFIWTYGSGAMGSKPIITASDVTLGGVTNELIVTKANGGYLTYLIFELNNSKMNIVSS